MPTSVALVKWTEQCIRNLKTLRGGPSRRERKSRVRVAGSSGRGGLRGRTTWSRTQQIRNRPQEALARGFGGQLRFGAAVAFMLAATPFTLAGFTSAVWALVAGLATSFAVERGELLAHWDDTCAMRKDKSR